MSDLHDASQAKIGGNIPRKTGRIDKLLDDLITERDRLKKRVAAMQAVCEAAEKWDVWHKDEPEHDLRLAVEAYRKAKP